LHASWWDMFKDKHFPHFLLRWFPIKYDVKSVCVKKFLIGHEVKTPSKNLYSCERY
jgi:hypothetical protein